ncbi:MAG: fibronectin type III domain-containing protein [Thermoanaerobaculia bacterium]
MAPRSVSAVAGAVAVPLLLSCLLSIGLAPAALAANAAIGLYALPTATDHSRLSWLDPNADETGFRVERSPSGTVWAPVGAAGANDTEFVDAALSAGTVYYYRLVTLTAGGDGDASNIATATTFPAVAARVCVGPLDVGLTSARFPAAAWNGVDWGAAWQERDATGNNEIFLQRLAGVDGTPIGSPANLSQSDSPSQFPTLRWNGARFGLVSYEGMRGEPGAANPANFFFSLLRADGSPLRARARPFGAAPPIGINSSFETALVWDGSRWDYLGITDTAPYQEVTFARWSETGDLELGPLVISSVPSTKKTEVAAAWSPSLGKVGAAWIAYRHANWYVYFQRVEESTGVAESPVLLASSSNAYGWNGTHVAWDGTHWAVAWTAYDPTFSDGGVYLQTLLADGTPIGAPQRISDPATVEDFGPQIFPKPPSGFAVFATSDDPTPPGSYEIGRLTADADGNPTGSRVQLSPSDALFSTSPRIATDGTRFLAVYNDNGGGSHEIADLLVDASGVNPPSAPTTITAGHSPGNAFLNNGPGNARAATLGAGFVFVWTDASTAASRFGARIVDGSGTTVADVLPFPPRPGSGTPGLASLGGTFALAWRETGTNDILFQRFDSTGSALFPETQLSDQGTNRAVALEWNGEVYGALWQENGSLTFQRVAPSGALVGGKLTVLGSCGGSGPALLWVGSGWAVLWPQNGNLYFGLLNPDGSVAVPAVQIAASPLPNILPIGGFTAAWNGKELAVAWSQIKGPLDPPGQDIYFTVLHLDGSKAFPEVVAVSTDWDDRQPQLYWDTDRFRLVHVEGLHGALREVALLPNGTLLPGERFLANRGGRSAIAWNGVALALAWVPSNLQRLYVETSACLADPSRPPCPGPTATLDPDDARLDWGAVVDPESGIWRYDLYRDGAMLAEISPSHLSFVDRGAIGGATHSYELRALNGAFSESAGCSPVALAVPLFGDHFESGDLRRWWTTEP